MKMNGIQIYNCLSNLVHCGQEEQYGVVTQDGIAQNFGFLKCPILTYVWCI